MAEEKIRLAKSDNCRSWRMGTWEFLFYFCLSLKFSMIKHFYFFWLGHTACEILVPPPGIELGPPQWKHQVLTTGPPGNCQKLTSFIQIFVSQMLSFKNVLGISWQSSGWEPALPLPRAWVQSLFRIPQALLCSQKTKMLIFNSKNCANGIKVLC